MALTLPECLLLFALHDDKGTVHSTAYLALDPALRGAVIAELKLRGHVQVRTAGDVRWHPSPPTEPLPMAYLGAASEALRMAPSPAPVATWLAALAVELPDLRDRVQAALEQRGVLGSPDRPQGSGQVAYPVADPSAEANIRRAVVDALDAREAIRPRLGSLVGLTVACHLAQVVFGGRAGEADALATWVADRDAVLRSVVEAIAQTEGEW